MRTFIFIADKDALNFRKCRVYKGKLNFDEVSQRVLEKEILINWEYANICTFY